MKRYLILICCLFLVRTTTVLADNSSLRQKWETMLEKAETYEPYKVIKKVELHEFWKSVQDSLSRYQKELKEERKKVQERDHSISELKASTTEAQSQLKLVESDKNSVSYLGIKANKYVYLSVLFILLLGACGLVGFLFYLYTNSNNVTVQKISAYEKLSREFDEYKLGKIELERKLRRELQTQINKLEELKGRK